MTALDRLTGLVDQSLRDFDGWDTRATGPYLLVIGPIVSALLLVQLLHVPPGVLKTSMFTIAVVTSAGLLTWTAWRFFVVHGTTAESERDARRPEHAKENVHG